MPTYEQRYDPLIRAADATTAVATFNSLATTIAGELSIAVAAAEAKIVEDVGVLLREYSAREQERMYRWIGAQGPMRRSDFPDAYGTPALEQMAGVVYTGGLPA